MWKRSINWYCALDKEDGRLSGLILGLIESTPFQRTRKLQAADLSAEIRK